MRKYKLVEALVEEGVATIDEINLVCAIAGYSEETLLEILRIRTHCRNLTQLKIKKERNMED